MGYFHDTADIVAEELRRAGFPQFDEALSVGGGVEFYCCLLYTSPSPRDS